MAASDSRAICLEHAFDKEDSWGFFRACSVVPKDGGPNDEWVVDPYLVQFHTTGEFVLKQVATLQVCLVL